MLADSTLTGMPVTYSQFLTLIASALRDENGLDLAYLIRPVSAHSKDLIKEFRNPTVRRGSDSLQLFNSLTRS